MSFHSLYDILKAPYKERPGITKCPVSLDHTRFHKPLPCFRVICSDIGQSLDRVPPILNSSKRTPSNVRESAGGPSRLQKSWRSRRVRRIPLQRRASGCRKSRGDFDEKLQPRKKADRHGARCPASNGETKERYRRLFSRICKKARPH